MKTRVLLVREGRKSDVEITTPEHIYKFMARKAAGLDREHLWRIDLDARSHVIGYELVSMGTLTASLVHPREVYTGALLNKAATIIVVHNHPSGDSSPSEDDKTTTNRLVKAGEILGIPIIDHVIIADKKYCSMRDRGLIS